MTWGDPCRGYVFESFDRTEKSGLARRARRSDDGARWVGWFRFGGVAMKTVLLITAEESHRLIYEPALKQCFAVVCRALASGAPLEVAAVVYDLPKHPAPEDFHWLEELGVPVVVLTPKRSLRLPKAPSQRVLTYLVRGGDILKALAELGVCSGAEC